MLPRIRSLTLAAALACTFATGAAHADFVNLTGTYTQNFDGMGASGTTPPAGWSVYTGNSGTSNTTWSTSIPGNGTNSVASMVLTTAALTVNNAPTATNNNGYNAANIVTGNTSDRVLATSPTQVSGAALQLAMTNNTGAALNSLDISYDTLRFNTVSTPNELPGYELFYSLDDSTWTNVAAFNATSFVNSVGVSTTSGLVTFSSTLAAGANLYLRWVDDNAVQTSPDQIIGLNNVVVAAVPEPETYALMLAGLGLLGFVARRRKQQAA